MCLGRRRRPGQGGPAWCGSTGRLSRCGRGGRNAQGPTTDRAGPRHAPHPVHSTARAGKKKGGWFLAADRRLSPRPRPERRRPVGRRDEWPDHRHPTAAALGGGQNPEAGFSHGSSPTTMEHFAPRWGGPLGPIAHACAPATDAPRRPRALGADATLAQRRKGDSMEAMLPSAAPLGPWILGTAGRRARACAHGRRPHGHAE